jgi:hypothetical protein
MYPDTPSVSQLSHVISQAAAPAFLLGALAAFIAVLISRLNRVIDRTIVLNAISEDDTFRCRLKADLPRLMRRAAMLNRANGRAGFFCVGGAYQIKVTSGALTYTRNYVPIGKLQELDEWDYITTATSRTVLKAVPSTIKTVALAESGRFGLFNVVSGDFSATGR